MYKSQNVLKCAHSLDMYLCTHSLTHLVFPCWKDANMGGMNCKPDECAEQDFRSWAGDAQPKGWGFNKTVSSTHMQRCYSTQQTMRAV
jgi:hypothetical protein